MSPRSAPNLFGSSGKNALVAALARKPKGKANAGPPAPGKTTAGPFPKTVRYTGAPSLLATGLPADYGSPTLHGPKDTATLARIAAKPHTSLGDVFGGVVSPIVHKVEDAFSRRPAFTPDETKVKAAYDSGQIHTLPAGWVDLGKGKAGVRYAVPPAKVNAGVFAPGTSIVSQLASGLAQDAIYNPGGVASSVLDPVGTAKKVAHGVEQTVLHADQNPTNAALLAFMLGSGVGSAAARVAGATKALKAGEGIGAAVTRPGHQGGSLLHSPEPGTHTIYVPGARPEPLPAPVTAPVLSGRRAETRLAKLEAEHKIALDEIANGLFGPVDRKAALDRGASNAKARRQQAGVDRSGRPSGASGRKATLRLSLADERRAQAEKAVQDVAGKNPDHPALQAWAARQDEIERLRATLNPEPAFMRDPAHAVSVGDVAEGPRNAVAVDRLLSRNPLVRTLVQAPRNRRLQAKLLKQPTSPRTNVGKSFASVFSAQATVGRELRAARRVEHAIANAPVAAQQRAVSGLLQGLSRGEHVAISVAATEGVRAFEQPAETIARQIATHQHFANLGGDVAANEQRITDLKLAQHVLEHPSGRFLKALELTRQLSKETEGKLIAAGHLTPEIAGGRRDAMSQLYGLESAPEEGFFHPMSSRYTQKQPGNVPGAFTPRPGEFGVGPVKAGGHVQALGKKFSGESVARGQTPVDIASTITDRAARVNRLLSAEDFYAHLWQVATTERRSTFDIPIRSTREVQGELRGFFTKLADHLHATPDEQLRLSSDELRRLTDMLEANEHHAAGVGAQIDGVRWVDRRYIKDLGETSLRGPVEKLADAVTNPVRTAQLYGRPAYILNLAGNLGMAGITEGVKTFPALRDAVLASKVDGPKNTALIDSLVGSGLSRSFAVGTGPLHVLNARLAEAWAAITDLHARRGAFFHEASKAGYRTAAERDRLLNDPALRRKLTEVTRRANKNLVDFSSLTPTEANTIRRLIYFYPWTSRGTIWALRTLVENPTKTFTLAQLGQIGAENAHRKLGTLPAWAEQLGLIPVGDQHDGLQGTINPSSLNTYATAAQTLGGVLKLGTGLVHTARTGALADSLTPAAEAFIGLAGGDTGPPPGGYLGKLGTAGRIAASLPQVAALRRSGIAPGVAGPPSKSYPDSGVGPALGPLAAGGLYPRNLNLDEMHKSASRETSSQQGKLRIDLQRAVDAGLLTTKDAAGMLENANGASDAEIKDARRQILTYLREAKAAG